MSRSARYVTQSGLYDCPVLGPLTNRKINAYQNAGRLPGKANEVRPLRRQKSLRDLLGLYQ